MRINRSYALRPILFLHVPHAVRAAAKEKADGGADRGKVAHGRDGQVQAPAGKREVLSM